jgi:hypothetical protein
MLRESDLDAYAEKCADPEVMRFIGDGQPLIVRIVRSTACTGISVRGGESDSRARFTRRGMAQPGLLFPWRPGGRELQWPRRLSPSWTVRGRHPARKGRRVAVISTQLQREPAQERFDTSREQ